MTRKYTLSVPDSSMFGMRLSGVSVNRNPFKVVGEILLQVDRIGMIQYTVARTDFKRCFPVNEKFWSISHMFCTAMNINLNERMSPQDPYFNLEASRIQQRTSFFIYSKHKVDNTHWKVLIYDPSEEKFYPHAEDLINSGAVKVEFVI